MRTTMWSAILAIAIACAPAGARAQDAADAASDHDEEARSLFEAGRRAFTAGRYEDALDCFQRAFALSDRAALLYNVGATADRLRQSQVALDAFVLYLERMPDAPNRAEVEGRVRLLRQELEERAAAARAHEEATRAAAEAQAAAEAARASRATEPSDLQLGVAGIVTAGVGGAAAIVGIAFGAVALDTNSALERDRAVLDRAAQEQRVAEIDRDALVFDVLVGAGAAAAVAGTVMAIVGLSPHGGEAEVTVAPTAGGLVIRGRF